MPIRVKVLWNQNYLIGDLVVQLSLNNAFYIYRGSFLLTIGSSLPTLPNSNFWLSLTARWKIKEHFSNWSFQLKSISWTCWTSEASLLRLKEAPADCAWLPPLLLSAKKIKAPFGSPVFFDSRIQHRGSPINDKYIKDTKKIDDYKAKTLTHLKNVKNEIRFINQIQKNNNYNITIEHKNRLSLLFKISSMYAMECSSKSTLELSPRAKFFMSKIRNLGFFIYWTDKVL